MSSTTVAPTDFETALDDVLGEGDAADATEETSTEEAGDLSLETDEAAATETEKGGEKQPDAESAAADAEKEGEQEEELDLKEEGDGEKADAKDEEEDELEEELSQDDEIKPDSEDEKNLYFKKSKAHRLMESHADMKAIREEIPNANVEMLKEHYETHGAHTAMMEDFDSGGFDGMGKVLNYLVGNPDEPETVKAVNEQSVQVFAASLPSHLAKTHPQAMGILESIILKATVDQQYRKAEALEKSGADTKKVEQAYALAENNELDIFKKVRTRGQSEQSGTSERERQLEQENIQLRKGEETRQQQTHQGRAAAIDKAVRSADNEEIDVWLTKLENSGAKFSEREVRHIRRDVQDAIDKGVKSNTAWRRQFDTQRSAATRKFSEESRDNLKATRRGFVSQFVRRSLREAVKENTKTSLDASKRTHDRQNQTQERRQSPPTGERTSRKLDVGKAFKEGKMTFDELIDKAAP